MSALNRQLQGLGERREGDLPPLSVCAVPKVRVYPWKTLGLLGSALALGAFAFAILGQDNPDLASPKTADEAISVTGETPPSVVPAQVTQVLSQLTKSASATVQETTKQWQQAVAVPTPTEAAAVVPETKTLPKVTPQSIAETSPKTAKSSTVENVSKPPQNRLNIEEKAVSSAQLAARSRQQGETFWRKGDAENALSAFEQSLRHDPNQIPVRQRLASIHYGRGDIWSAEKTLLAGFAPNADNLELRWTLAKLWGQEQQFKKALSYLSLKPKSAPSNYWLLRAQLAQRCKNHPMALSSFEQLTQNFPQLDAGWLGFAIESERAGQLSVAKTAYRRVLASKTVSASSLAFAEDRLRLMEITS